MKSNSDHYPELTVQSAGKTQIRYNIKEKIRTEMDGSTKTVYEFDYINVDGEVSKEKIIEAMLAAEEPAPEVAEPAIEPIKEPELEPEAKIIDVKMVEEAITEAKVSIAEAKKVKPVKDLKEEPIKEKP